MEHCSKDWTGVKSAPLRIDDQAWIGCNSLIPGGVHIGRGAIVGAGSVVTHDIPPFTVFAGNPARFVKAVSRPLPAAGPELGRRGTGTDGTLTSPFAECSANEE